MNNNQNHSKDFLIGAAVGTVIGGITALLMAPKKGEEFRKDIMDAYDDISEKTQGFAEDVSNRGRAFAENFGSQVSEFAEEAHETIKDGVNKCMSCEEDLKKGKFKNKIKKDLRELRESSQAQPETFKGMLIGGAVGSALGIATGMLLSPKTGEDLRQGIKDVYEDLDTRFRDTKQKLFKQAQPSLGERFQFGTKQLLDIGNQLLSKFEPLEEKGAEKSKEMINNLAEWASLGIQAFQKINQTLAKK